MTRAEAVEQAPDPADLQQNVTDMYTSVAEDPGGDRHFPVGRKAAEFVGYPASDLDPLPEDALARFAGVGYPFQADAIRPGDTVLDVGSGSGTDLLIAADHAGDRGLALGIDLTEAMLGQAQENLRAAGAHNAIVLHGDAGERIPLPAGAVDVVTSNGVINLVPDKAAAFQEIHRVLAPGGRLQLADIVVNVDIPDAARCDGELWAACIAGALLESDYLDAIRGAGFQDVEVVNRLDYFSAAPREDARETAAHYKAEAVVITARRGPE